MHKYHHDQQIAAAVGDVFRVESKRMTVLAIDQSVVWLRDDCGEHYERRIQQLAQCGKYADRSTDLPGYPIAEMPEDGNFYLVSIKDCQDNPGSTRYNLCRKVDGFLNIKYTGGVYYGATHYHPFRFTYQSGCRGGDAFK